MIFVTVGNATQPFERLLQAVDELAGANQFLGDPVLMQIGHNPDFKAHHSQVKAFLAMDDCLARMQEAKLIISHGGCGTLLQAIGFGKTPVVMPRLARYGEHVNDHQLQLVKALVDEKRIVPAYDVNDLPHAIQEALNRPPQAPPRGQMLTLVSQAIHDLL